MRKKEFKPDGVMPQTGEMQCCGDEGTCPETVTVHVLYDVHNGAGGCVLLCPECFVCFKRQHPYVAKHKATVNCDMPGVSWEKGKCAL